MSEDTLTPLQRKQQQALYEATLNDDVSWMQRLLAEGVDPNWPVSENSMPHNISGFYEAVQASCLHIAVSEQNSEAVRLLLNWGADVNATDKTGQTPLHYACKADAPREADMLMAAGAQENVLDMDGKTPVQLSQSHAHDEPGEAQLVIDDYALRPRINPSSEQVTLKERLLRVGASGYDPLDNPRVWQQFGIISDILLQQDTPISKDEMLTPNDKGQTVFDRAIRFRAVDKLLDHLHAQGEYLDLETLLEDTQLLDGIVEHGGVQHLFSLPQLREEGVQGMRRLQEAVGEDAMAMVRNGFGLAAQLRQHAAQQKEAGR
jgi:hypothetical protein